MSSKTIHQLTPVKQGTEYTGEIRTLDDILRGTSLETNYKDVLGYIDPNDEFPISHKHNENDYVTYKTTISDLEGQLFPIRRAALTKTISSDLSLGDLAWKNKSELRLSGLSHQDNITYDQIVTPSTTNVPGPNEALSPENAKAIPLKQINADFGDLAFTNAAQLELGDLAHRSYITDAQISSSKLDLKTSIKGWKNLALSSEEDLGLGPIAKMPAIGLNMSNILTGYLPASRVSDLPQYSLPVATPSILGGIRTGYVEQGNGNYALALDDNDHKAYVNVPWTDTRTTDWRLTTTGKINGFDISMSYLSVQLSSTGSSVKTRKTLSSHVNITPSIDGNVVFDRAYSLPSADYLGVFSTGTTATSVKVKKLDCKVDLRTENSTERYLAECGKWKSIIELSSSQDATQEHHGLLSQSDKVFIDTLSAKNDIFYTLPCATTTKLGGIKVATADQAGNSYEYYAAQECSRIPVRIDEQQHAYVALPKSIGNPEEFQKTMAGSSVNALSALLDKIYPVGAIYMIAKSGNDNDLTACPLQALMPGSQWEKIQGRYLLASGQLGGTSGNAEKYVPTNTPDAGLPAHTHTIDVGCGSCSCSDLVSVKNSHHSGYYSRTTSGASNAIYGRSNTVRPPAYVVNVFRRTR